MADEIDIANDKVLKEFERKMTENMESLDPEFQKVIDENFWDLIEE